jgi:hypothetical protein
MTKQAGVRGPARVVVDVGGYRTPDLVLVDVLTRVCLVTRRLGGEFLVLGAGEDLDRLLALVGLLGVVPLAPRDGAPRDGAPGGGSERGREPEAREQASVQEVVDVRDPAVPQLQHLDRPGRELPGAAGLVLGEGG